MSSLRSAFSRFALPPSNFRVFPLKSHEFCRRFSELYSQGSNPDILLQNMKSATDAPEVLETVRKHHTIMNHRHIMQAFRSLFALQKADSLQLSNGEIVKSSAFKVLCSRLKVQVRSIDLNDTIDALKTLSYLGVPASAKISQILLNLIAKQINDLSLHQIIFIDFMIKDFESCPIVKVLKLALPIVFTAQVITKADLRNIGHLTEYLSYASRKGLEEPTKDFLIEHLMKNRENIDFKCAKSIIRSMCDLHRTDESHRPLLYHSLDVVIDNIARCSYHDVDSLLSKLCSKYSVKNYYFYHEEFMNTSIKFIINSNCNFQEGVWILRKAVKFGHVSYDLLDFLAQKAEKNSSVLENCGTLILFSFVSGFAMADYKPRNWDILQPIILKNASQHLAQVELPWVKFGRDLGVLDCWPMDIYESIFDESFIKKYLARDYNFLDHLQILALYQAVKNMVPWYSGPMPSENVLEKAINMNGTNVNEYPLQFALWHGLGGQEYVTSEVYTKLGHFMDHIFVLRKGGYPIPISFGEIEKRKYMENLLVPDDCEVVAVLYLPPTAYTTNTNRLKGPHRLSIDSLKAMGVKVVHVSSTSWESLMEQERVPYLMRLLRDESRLVCELN